MLLFGWPPLVLLFPCLPVPLTIVWWLYRTHQLQLVSLLLSYAIDFFSSLARSRYLSLLLLSFSFTLWSAGRAKFTIGQVFFFFFFFLLLTITTSGRLAANRWSAYISKPQITLCVSFSGTDSGRCIYNRFVCSNSNFLHSSHWITFLSESCLVLYPPWANLQPWLIMWLIVLSLSPHNLHLLFCCILSSLALT